MPSTTQSTQTADQNSAVHDTLATFERGDYIQIETEHGVTHTGRVDRESTDDDPHSLSIVQTRHPIQRWALVTPSISIISHEDTDATAILNHGTDRKTTGGQAMSTPRRPTITSVQKLDAPDENPDEWTSEVLDELNSLTGDSVEKIDPSGIAAEEFHVEFTDDATADEKWEVIRDLDVAGHTVATQDSSSREAYHECGAVKVKVKQDAFWTY